METAIMDFLLRQIWEEVPQSRKYNLKYHDGSWWYDPYIPHKQRRRTLALLGYIPKKPPTKVATLASFLTRQCGLNQKQAKSWDDLWKRLQTFPPIRGTILFTRHPRMIEHVYVKAPHSCIGGKLASEFTSPVHPARIYANNRDVAVAYYVDSDGEIKGRGVCVPAERAYVRWYGAGETIINILGYKRDTSCLIGKTFPILAEHEHEDRIVAPFIDGDGGWLVQKEEGTVTLEEYPDPAYDCYYVQYPTSKQHGWSCIKNTKDYYLPETDEGVYSRWAGEYVPHGETLAVYIYDFETETWEEDVVHERWYTTHVHGLSRPVVDDQLQRLLEDEIVVETAGDGFFLATSPEVGRCDLTGGWFLVEELVPVYHNGGVDYVSSDYIERYPREFRIRHGVLEYSEVVGEYTLDDILDEHIARAQTFLKKEVIKEVAITAGDKNNVFLSKLEQGGFPPLNRLYNFLDSLGLTGFRQWLSEYTVNSM